MALHKSVLLLLLKSEEKRTSGEAYDINKQTIYIVPKSKIESREHYDPKPAQGREEKGKGGRECKQEKHK